jgi:hypothetical protein
MKEKISMTYPETAHWRPKAKGKSLLIVEAGDEVLVYDLTRHRAYCLNETAARVWRLCTGKRTVAQIASELKIALDPALGGAVVRDTIAQFERLGLVEAADRKAPDLSRRKLFRRIGIGAAAGIALPLVTWIVAPTPAHAASCTGNAGLCGPGHPPCCPGLSCQDNNGTLICQSQLSPRRKIRSAAAMAKSVKSV